VAVLSVLVIFFQMPRRMMPYVESPIVGVVSMMPGLSAEEMEIYFSKPIEERMVDLKNVRFVRSTSQEGFSIVSVEFWYGVDVKQALFDVQALMNVVQADLPMTGANLKPSWVLAIDPLNIPVLSLAVTGEGYDPVQLRTLVENEIVNRLKTVKDVYSVVPFGGQKLQMQVIVDQDNGTSWLDWRLLNVHPDVFRFARQTIAFRKDHPSLCRSRFWRDDIRWYGVGPQADFSHASRSLALCLHGASQGDDDVYVMVNEYWETLDFTMQDGAPARSGAGSSTRGARVRTTSARRGRKLLQASARYTVGPRSVVVLVRSRRT
jgi:hypothetical protein